MISNRLNYTWNQFHLPHQQEAFSWSNVNILEQVTHTLICCKIKALIPRSTIPAPHPGILKEYSVILTTSFYDMNQEILTKKAYFQISVDSNLRLQVVHFHVHWHCSTDYCVKLSLVDETLCKILLLFHKEMISA